MSPSNISCSWVLSTVNPLDRFWQFNIKLDMIWADSLHSSVQSSRNPLTNKFKLCHWYYHGLSLVCLTERCAVTSVSLTPPQALPICKNDHVWNVITTPPTASQAPRELPTDDVQKNRYVIGLVNESKTQTITPVLVAHSIGAQLLGLIS